MVKKLRAAPGFIKQYLIVWQLPMTNESAQRFPDDIGSMSIIAVDVMAFFSRSLLV